MMCPPALAATVDVYPGDDLWAAIEAAAPGDEVVAGEVVGAHAGTWTTQQASGSWYRSVELEGTAEAWITARAAEGEVVILEGDPAGSQNIVDLSGAYYTWAGFEMVYGSHGLRVGQTAHAVFEDLHIHDTGDVGISMNRDGATYEDVVIRGLHIHDTHGTGECMYLGCNDDACQVFDALIEWNWCHDTWAASQGDGVELKTGSYNTIVRHNVIHDVRYPGITMYGTRGRAANQVYGNVIWGAGDNGIQVVGDVVVGG